MINGICESPLAIESIIAWYKALKEGEILLREVIDLDATYTGGPQAQEDKTQITEVEEEGEEETEEEAADDTEEEAEEEVTISLSAMEEELSPKVFAMFGKIEKTYKKMQKVQVIRLESLAKGDEPADKDTKKYNKHKDEMVELMNEVHLNNKRIEQLIDLSLIHI